MSALRRLAARCTLWLSLTVIGLLAIPAVLLTCLIALVWTAADLTIAGLEGRPPAGQAARAAAHGPDTV